MKLVKNIQSSPLREATRSDLEAIMHLSKAWYDKIGLPLNWDSDTMELQVRNLMIISNGFLFVWDEGEVTGAVGGPVIMWPYDANIQVAQEYFCIGDHQKELKISFYERVQEEGAQAVIRLCVDPVPGARMALFKEVGNA